jgi:arsenate reductase
MSGRTFDFVITVCDNAKESCPIFPGEGEIIHHSFADPAAAASTAEQPELFRRTRDKIAAWLRVNRPLATATLSRS